MLFFSATNEGTPYEQLLHDWPVRATPNKFWAACLLEKTKQQTYNQEGGGCVSRPSANPWCKFTTHQKEKILIWKISLAGQLSLGDKQKQFGRQECFCRFLSVTMLKVMFHFSQAWGVFSCSHIFMLHSNKSLSDISHDMENKFIR